MVREAMSLRQEGLGLRRFQLKEGDGKTESEKGQASLARLGSPQGPACADRHRRQLWRGRSRQLVQGGAMAESREAARNTFGYEARIGIHDGGMLEPRGHAEHRPA